MTALSAPGAEDSIIGTKPVGDVDGLALGAIELGDVLGDALGDALGDVVGAMQDVLSDDTMPLQTWHSVARAPESPVQ